MTETLIALLIAWGLDGLWSYGVWPRLGITNEWASIGINIGFGALSFLVAYVAVKKLMRAARA